MQSSAQFRAAVPWPSLGCASDTHAAEKALDRHRRWPTHAAENLKEGFGRHCMVGLEVGRMERRISLGAVGLAPSMQRKIWKKGSDATAWLDWRSDGWSDGFHSERSDWLQVRSGVSDTGRTKGARTMQPVRPLGGTGNDSVVAVGIWVIS